MSQPITQPAEQRPATAVRPTRVRWKVLAWLCSLAAITYVGRVGAIQVREDIEASLHLTPAITAWAFFSAFNLAYALFEIPSGRLGDKLGPRRVLTRIVLCWMTFTALTGAAWDRWSLAFCRFLFGAGEAGAFPNIARASREWFPFAERGLAQGLVWMFARWGGAIAPLLMMVLALPFGWRGSFALMSVLGMIWVWTFYRNFRDTPQQDARVNEAECALIAGTLKDTSKPAPLSWSTMLLSRTLWALSIMYFCSNAGWSFFASWITDYLKKDLHLSGIQLVLGSGGPLFFGGISCLLGGFLTDRQVKMWGRRWGRTLLGAVSYGAGGGLFLLAVGATGKHVLLAYTAICLSSFIKDLGLASSWATTIDIGHRYSGTVAGVMNSLGNLGQVVAPPVVARLALRAGTPGHPNWKTALYFYAAMFFVASISWLFVNPRRVIVYSDADQQRLHAEGRL
jgi:MFS family permease